MKSNRIWFLILVAAPIAAIIAMFFLSPKYGQLVKRPPIKRDSVYGYSLLDTITVDTTDSFKVYNRIRISDSVIHLDYIPPQKIIHDTIYIGNAGIKPAKKRRKKSELKTDMLLDREDSIMLNKFLNQLSKELDSIPIFIIPDTIYTSKANPI